MNKIFSTLSKMLVALLAMFMLGIVSSCSDNDDVTPDNPETEITPEELAEMAAVDKFAAANSVIRALAMVSELPDNWENTTFEPQAGIVLDEANADVRNMVSTSVADAENYFLSIVPDLGLNGNTWSHEGVGSLTFRALNEKNCYAVIDVNLVQMPGLKQLRFVPKEVLGENAYTGTPYYSAGDLVVDKKGVYWICVRPAGGPEGKGWAYFVSFDGTRIGDYVKEVEQNIYAIGSKGKLDKNQPYECSGKWYYAKSLVDERTALAAAHTFAMLKLEKGKDGGLNFAAKAEELSSLYGFDVSQFDNMADIDDIFSCNIAYGNYVSNKHTKVRQEKYLQPFMRVTIANLSTNDLAYEFTQLVEKVSLDPNQKKASSPYLLSLTSDYNPTAFGLLYNSTNIVGYSDQTFNIMNYGWNFGPGESLAPYTRMSYMNGYLNEKVLVMKHTCVKDNGNPSKDFKLVTKERMDKPLYWEALEASTRVLYDVKDNGTKIEEIVD